MRGHAARKQEDKLGDLEFGPWLGQASILVVDDEPGMRGFLVRSLGEGCGLHKSGVPGRSEHSAEFRLVAIATSAACRKR